MITTLIWKNKDLITRMESVIVSKFNIIYEDKIVKTSINFRKDLMIRVKERMKELNIEQFSVYVRALIIRDLQEHQSISLTKFLNIESSEDVGFRKWLARKIKKFLIRHRLTV